MKSALTLLQPMPVLAALSLVHEVFAAEDRSTARNSPPPPVPTAAYKETTATNSTESAKGLASVELPPLPPGVTELKFSEFFRQPIGPRGLEYTEKLRSLDGRRIRILGHMARQAKSVDHGFLLAPVPLTLNEIEYGLADDLPVTALHVFTTPEAPIRTPYTPGPLLLTGRLSLGNRLEADGRTSSVRLYLDPPTPEQQQAAQQAAAKNAAVSPAAHDGHGH